MQPTLAESRVLRIHWFSLRNWALSWSKALQSDMAVAYSTADPANCCPGCWCCLRTELVWLHLLRAPGGNTAADTDWRGLIDRTIGPGQTGPPREQGRRRRGEEHRHQWRGGAIRGVHWEVAAGPEQRRLSGGHTECAARPWSCQPPPNIVQPPHTTCNDTIDGNTWDTRLRWCEVIIGETTPQRQIAHNFCSHWHPLQCAHK